MKKRSAIRQNQFQKLIGLSLLLTILLGQALSVAAQEKVTPVDVDDDAPRVVLHYYDRHGNQLQEPVRFLATLDTVKEARPGPTYPLYNGASVGINFGDAIMMAFGQKYASFDLHADVSLHNWFFPTVEAGLGFARSKPDHGNFTYRTSPSFYLKAGLNYNFLYKSNPDYQLFLGLRAGFSRFSYSAEDITISDSYWQENQQLSLNGLHSTAFWGEALIGLKVKISGRFSWGWSMRVHTPFSVSRDRYSKPWFIPGYGGTDSPLAVSVSAIFTIPPGRKTAVSSDRPIPDEAQESVEEPPTH